MTIESHLSTCVTCEQTASELEQKLDSVVAACRREPSDQQADFGEQPIDVANRVVSDSHVPSGEPILNRIANPRFLDCVFHRENHLTNHSSDANELQQELILSARFTKFLPASC